MRRMVRLPVLAGLAVVLATGCGARTAGAGGPESVTASAGGGVNPSPAASSPGGGDVPWIDKAAPVASPSASASLSAPASPPAPVAKYPACTAGELAGHTANSAPTMGSTTTIFVITNVSTRACTLTGPPSSATGLGADGTRQALAVAALNGRDDLLGPPANLRPGQGAQAVTFSAKPGVCSPSRTHTFAALDIGVGSTGTVRVTFPGGAPLTLISCGDNGLTMFGFGVPAPVNSPPPAPLRVLTVSRSMPASVAPGSVAHYTVTLTNPTAHAVPLSPCPSYEEFIAIVAPAAARTTRHNYSYYLNCRAAPDIPAHGSVTFDMEMPVPSGSGQAKYGWILQVSQLGTGGVTQVSG